VTYTLLPDEPQEFKMLPDEPSVQDKLARQGGLFARSAVSGAAALPALGADALGYILNLGIKAYNAQTGSQIPEFQPQMQKLEQNLSGLGLPEPETGTERVVYAANKALAGQAGTIAAGSRVPGAVGELLTTRPDVQLQAALGSGLGSSLAGEAGAGPVGQTLAGVAGAVAVPSAVSLVKGVPGLIEPFTERGQRQIAGRVLSESAASPADAQLALKNAEEIVPGSSPTMAQAARDPGLASLERSLVAKPTGSTISQRYSQQNAARSAELDDLANADIDLMKSARNAATQSQRETALAGGKIGAPSDVVIANIDKTLKSPTGKREIVAGALEWAKGRLKGVTDPAELYEVRKDISDAMKGKLAGDKAVYKQASGELSDVIKMLDDAIESDAPGFKAYLQSYKDASKPINQKEVLQEIRRRVLATTEDSMGNRQVSAASFTRTMDNLDQTAATATGYPKAKAAEILSPKQMKRLEALRQDLSNASYAAGGGKVSGSNTVQLANYSTANLIGKVVSGRGDMGPVVRNLARGLDWVNKYNDRDIDRLLVEAAKDPALSALLMEKATGKNLDIASRELGRIAKAIGLGTATSQAQQQGKESRNRPQ